jgi:hypothetical protein
VGAACGRIEWGFASGGFGRLIKEAPPEPACRVRYRVARGSLNGLELGFKLGGPVETGVVGVVGLFEAEGRVGGSRWDSDAGVP